MWALQKGYLCSETQEGPPHSSAVTVTSTDEVKPNLFGKQGLSGGVSVAPGPRLWEPEMGGASPGHQEATVVSMLGSTGGLRGDPLMGICPPLLLEWLLGILFEAVSVPPAWLAPDL